MANIWHFVTQNDGFLPKNAKKKEKVLERITRFAEVILSENRR